MHAAINVTVASSVKKFGIMFFTKKPKNRVRHASDEITRRAISGVFRILPWRLSLVAAEVLSWQVQYKAANSGGFCALEHIGYAGNENLEIRVIFSNRLHIIAERHGDPRMREMAAKLLDIWDQRYKNLTTGKELSRSDGRKMIAAMRTSIISPPSLFS